MLIDIQLHLIRTYLLWMIVFVCKCVTLHTTISDRTSSLEKSTFDNLFTESTTMFLCLGKNYNHTDDSWRKVRDQLTISKLGNYVLRILTRDL